MYNGPTSKAPTFALHRHRLCYPMKRSILVGLITTVVYSAFLVYYQPEFFSLFSFSTNGSTCQCMLSSKIMPSAKFNADNLGDLDITKLKLITTHTEPSYKMFVLNRMDDYLSRMYLRNISYEPELQHILKKCLAKSQRDKIVFFDIGANMGIHTLYIAALNYNVVAIEADAGTFSMLSQSIAINGFFGQIQAINAALTSSRGPITMVKNTGNIGQTHITDINQPISRSETRHTVKGIKLDDVLPCLQQPEIVLKIDIEGHECHILNTEQASLLFTSKKIICIAMEFIPKAFRAKVDEKCVVKMIDMFTKFGYVPYFAAGRQYGQRIETKNMYHKVEGDILWLPSGARAEEYF